MNFINRPLDFLNDNRGKSVLVKLRDGREIVGLLLAFDIHINLVLDSAKEIIGGEKHIIGLSFIRGDAVIYISLPER